MNKNVMEKGYLWVMSEPGTQVTEEEYHDWYDNEHVPLRMDGLPEFVTGSRYKAADGQKPGWMAHYDITSMALFTDPRYTSLRANRSPREADLVSRLEVLNRRTCKLVSDTGYRFDIEKGEAAPFVVTVNGTTPVPANALKGVAGLQRTYTAEVVDSFITGYGHDPQPNTAPKYVTVFEFDSPAVKGSEAMRTLQSFGAEVRLWELYRSWPNTASR